MSIRVRVLVIAKSLPAKLEAIRLGRSFKATLNLGRFTEANMAALYIDIDEYDILNITADPASLHSLDNDVSYDCEVTPKSRRISTEERKLEPDL